MNPQSVFALTAQDPPLTGLPTVAGNVVDTAGGAFEGAKVPPFKGLIRTSEQPVHTWRVAWQSHLQESNVWAELNPAGSFTRSFKLTPPPFKHDGPPLPFRLERPAHPPS